MLFPKAKPIYIKRATQTRCLVSVLLPLSRIHTPEMPRLLQDKQRPQKNPGGIIVALLWKYNEGGRGADKTREKEKTSRQKWTGRTAQFSFPDDGKGDGGREFR